MQNYLVMSKKSSTFAPHFDRDDISRSRAVVARQAHNLKVGGSIPPSATREKPLEKAAFFICIFLEILFFLDAIYSRR